MKALKENPLPIKSLEDVEADDEESNDLVVQPGGVVINMPALPPPLGVNQAPVAPPAAAPNNAAANPIVAPNQVVDLQAPLIPAAPAAPRVRREFFLKTYFDHVNLALNTIVRDHPLKFLTLLLQAAMHNAVAYFLLSTWYYMIKCDDNYPYVPETLDPRNWPKNREFNVKL